MAGVVVLGEVGVHEDRWNLEVLAAAAHWALTLMRKCLRSWSDLIARRRRMRLRSRCYVEEMIPLAYRRTIQAWKLATIGQVHGRLLADRHLVKLLRRWHLAVRQACSMRILLQKNELRQRQKILYLWKRAAARIWRCRRILAIQRLRAKVQICGKALSAWRLRAAALAALRGHTQSQCRRQKEAVLIGWKQLCSQRLWGRMRLEMRRDHALLCLFWDWKWQVAAEATLRGFRAGREVSGTSLAFQRWKSSLRRGRAQCPQIHLRRSFLCWCHGVAVSRFTLRLDVKKAMCLLRRTWHAWRQHRYRMKNGERALKCSLNKHLTGEAFGNWQMAASGCSGIDLQEPAEASMDLLEVSASTQPASGKDTEAPDDVNRTLSDLSGLTLTEGSPILPALAFESSPEDMLKGYSQWIQTSPREMKMGQMQLKVPAVPPAFSGISSPASCPVSPQPPMAPTDSSRTTVPVPCLVKRERHWQSEVLRAWLGVCRRKMKSLAVEEALNLRATFGHFLAWQQLRLAQIYCKTVLCKSCLIQWFSIQQMHLSRHQSLTQKRLGRKLGLSFRCWREIRQRNMTLADGQLQRSLHLFSQRLLAEWQQRSRLSKRCQSMRCKQHHRLLVFAFRVWRSRCEQRRRAVAIFHGRMLHLTAKTWIGWCDYRSFVLASADRLANILQRCVGSTLGRRAAFQRWALHSRGKGGHQGGGADGFGQQTFVEKRMRKVQLLAQLTQCVARWRQQELRRVLCCWWKVPLRRQMQDQLNAKGMQDLLAALERWRIAVQHIKSFRQMVMRHALCRWRSWRGLQNAGRKAKKVCEANSQLWTLRCWQKLHLARHSSCRRQQKATALVAWRAAVRTIHHERLAIHAPFQQWHAMLCKVQQLRRRQRLCAWRGVTMSRQHQRSVLQSWRHATLELGRQRLQKSFNSWRLYHAAFSNAAKMTSVSRTGLLIESWTFWTQAVSRWRAKQSVKANCQQRRMRQMLGAWSSLHRVTMQRHALARRLLPGSWARWRQGVAIRRAWKFHLQNALELWSAGLVVVRLERHKRIFRAWHLFVRSQHRRTWTRFTLAMWTNFVKESRQSRSQKCLAGWRAITKVAATERDQKAQVWSCWQQLLEEQRICLQRQQRCRAFRAWHSVLLTSRFQLRRLRSSYRAWRMAVTVQKVTRRKKSKEWLCLWHIGIWNSTVLDSAWVHWQLLAAASRRRRGAQVLRLWYHESHQRHQGRALLGAWRVVVSLARLPYLFHAWRAVLLSRRSSRSSLRFVLLWWFSFARQVKSLKRLTFRALLMALQNRRSHFLSAVFTSWRVFQIRSRRDQRWELLVLKSWASVRPKRIQQAKAMRQFAESCERSMVMSAEASARAAARIFHAWRFCCQRRQARRKCAEALQVARERPLRVALDGFRRNLLERQRSARLGPLAQQLSSCCERRLSSTYSRWRQATRCLGLRGRYDRAILSETLRRWQAHNLHGKSLEVAVTGIAARRSRRFCLTYFQNWHSAARKCCLSEWLLRWRCAVAAGQTQADLAKAFFRKRLLQRAFGHWEMSLHCGQLRGWTLKVPRFASRFRPRDFSELMAAPLRLAEQ